MLSFDIRKERLLKNLICILFAQICFNFNVFGYEIVLVEGNVMLDQPGQQKRVLKSDDSIQEWDRLKINNDGKLNLKTSEGAIVEVSKNSLLQFVKCRCSDQINLRILQGRLRVINESEGKVKVETLNAVLKIAKSKIDVIISAMNTLVAPREGAPVMVSTSQARKPIETGFYGLVNSEGALLRTVAAGKKEK